MKKVIRSLVFGTIIATPLLLTPAKSHAGVIGDILRDIFGKNDKDKKDKTTYPAPTTPGNSVPLNEGTVFLVIAGLGLGAKLIYDRRTKVENPVI